MSSDPEDQPKPRREIRIPIPDLSEITAKVSEKKENAFAAMGGWMKRHPLLSAIIFVVLIQVAVATVKAVIRHG